MASLARPKRAGEEFTRTHEFDMDGPSSTKKPRFDLRNPSALAPDAVEPDDVLDFDELGRRGQRVKRNAVNIDGYGSDSDNENFNARAEKKAKANNRAGADDNDDMFAELEEDFANEDAVTDKRRQVRFLENEEIEGQVAESKSGGRVTLDNPYTNKRKGKRKEGEGGESSESDTDEEGRAAIDDEMDKELGAGSKKRHAPLLDAFNMRSEQEEGRFDEAGNYVRKAIDADAVHDSWLEGVSKKDIRKAKQAAEKREEERRQKDLASDRILTSDILKTLIPYLERGETVLEALARLGKGIKQRPKRQNRNKNKSKKSHQAGTEDVEMGGEDTAATGHKRAIEQITEAADLLLTRGQPEIYDTERERLIRRYRQETGEDWVEPVAAAEHSNGETDGKNVMWEYRWSDARDGGQTYGPYDQEMMQSWSAAGYFSGNVEFRKVGTSEEWTATTNFKY